MAERTKVKTKDVGQVVGMLVSSVKPSNEQILWFDTTVESGCPIKYCDPSDHLWYPLKDSD